MRFVVYLVAVLAAAGIVYYVGTTGQEPIAASATAEVPAGTAAEGAELQMTSLKVPGMHCPMACYPSVKKTLESEAGVQAVDLVEQKQEGTIDNPVVIIKHGAGFDLNQAVASLEKRGFSDATVAEEMHD